MAMTEYRRHQLFQWMEEAMGAERAETMMDLLPPVAWTDIATKDDVAALGTSLGGEMAELRGEIAELRGDIVATRSELRGEMAELRGEMAELRGDLKSDMAQQSRLILFGMIGSQATLVGVVVAITRMAA